jgi:hypothetical protein
LPQINLCLLFGQQSRLPCYYRKLAGNMPDVKNLRKLLADMNTLDQKKIKVVLDRGFFSAANINDLVPVSYEVYNRCQIITEIRASTFEYCAGYKAQLDLLQSGLPTLRVFPTGRMGLCAGPPLKR